MISAVDLWGIFFHDVDWIFLECFESFLWIGIDFEKKIEILFGIFFSFFFIFFYWIKLFFIFLNWIFLIF